MVDIDRQRMAYGAAVAGVGFASLITALIYSIIVLAFFGAMITAVGLLVIIWLGFERKKEVCRTRKKDAIDLIITIIGVVSGIIFLVLAFSPPGLFDFATVGGLLAGVGAGWLAKYIRGVCVAE